MAMVDLDLREALEEAERDAADWRREAERIEKEVSDAEYERDQAQAVADVVMAYAGAYVSAMVDDALAACDIASANELRDAFGMM